MATIIEITEQPDDEITLNDKGLYEGQRSFLVKTDTPARPSIALNASWVNPATGQTISVPLRNAPYDAGFLNCRLQTKVASRYQGQDCHFIIKCDYKQNEGEPAETTPPEVQPNPLDDTPSFDYPTNESSEAYMIDERPYDEADPVTWPGRQYVTNSAGEPFEQDLEREVSQDIIVATVNEPTHDPQAAKALRHTVNLKTVRMDGKEYAPFTLHLKPVVSQAAEAKIAAPTDDDPDATETLHYFKKTYTFWFKPGGWIDRILDTGMNELVADPTSTATQPKPPKLRPIMDAASCVVKKPVSLNGYGQKLAYPAGTEVPDTIKSDPAKAYLWKQGERRFYPYKAVDWAEIPFVEEVA